MTYLTHSPTETEAVGNALAQELLKNGQGDTQILLYGDLGVGKTAFTRGFCSALGIARVKSPTYTVVNEYRGKDAAVAMAILKNTNKMVATDIAKLLKSAMANAEHNFGMDVEKLYVAECYVTPGILKNMKRVMPRAQGRAFRIIKRTSHVNLTLKERD